MRNVKYIVIHCTAGFSDAEAVQKYFLNTRGWNTGGYHRIIELDGTIKKVYPFDRITNGVLGYNAEAIHIAYVGGLDPEELKKGNFVAKDTRTVAQKRSIQKCITEAQNYIERRKDVEFIFILGHRDFSKDKDGSGVIESWERIKECPCFNAIEEYADFQINKGALPALPNI